MDETTKRDLNPPRFDTGGWNGQPSPLSASNPSDAPTRPTASAGTYDRPIAARPLAAPLTSDAVSGALPLEQATRGTGPHVTQSPDRPTSGTDAPFDRLTAGTASPALGAPADPTGMTYASKLPPDHPGLQLDKPKARTLRRGPLLTSVGILSAFVGIALVVALTPKSDPAKGASPNLTDAPNKDIALPDSVRDAPENNANLHQSPRLGPPLHGEQPGPAGAGPSEGPRQAMREERIKALSSPILVEMENPTLADQGGQPLAHGPAAAGASALASPDGVPGASAPPAPVATLAAGMADPNMQQHKNDFLTRDGLNNTSYVSQAIATPRSPYEVKAGTVIPMSLITGINSDLPGQIVGQVRENVYDTVTGNYLLIPQGSRLIATYDSSVTFGQERVLVCWNRLIRPDGISIALECMPGVDLAGYAGFSDEVDNHWWRVITGVALGTLVSATAQASQGNVSGYNPTIPQLWASNAGGAVNQAGQAITQKNLAIQPTIKVRPGFSVNVLVTKDIVLTPYNAQGVSP